MISRDWMERLLVLSLVALASVAMAVACGDSENEEEYTCCYNGAYYDCPDNEELGKCSQGEQNDCERQPSMDDECNDSNGSGSSGGTTTY